ncbi:MAG: hypothetical protein IPI29_08615 [Ignavibacteria bacterium]|nr:hypothetical protein [Ignavibacteria bacterium]
MVELASNSYNGSVQPDLYWSQQHRWDDSKTMQHRLFSEQPARSLKQIDLIGSGSTTNAVDPATAEVMVSFQSLTGVRAQYYATESDPRWNGAVHSLTNLSTIA